MEEKTLSKNTTICLVEDHDEIRNGIAFIINNHPNLHCIMCKSGEEALQVIKRSPPDLILMDINLPGINGIECTRVIKTLYPNMPILMCTVFDASDKVFDALKAGASGYILKRTAGETLIDAIRELLNGGAPMSTDIARKVVHSFRESPANKSEFQDLTNRENELLNLLAGGHSNKEIAERMHLSINTVRTHIYHIYEKLHVRNRVEALNKLNRG